MRHSPQSAFTLIELLLVVVILGILAAVAIPQFSDSSGEAKASSLQTNLAVLRNAIEYYKANHKGTYPGYPSGGGTPTAALFTNQMTLASKDDGSTAAVGTAGFGFGPYIRESIPANPASSTNLNTVKVLADADTWPAADDSTGWIYQPKTGKIRANSTGAAPSGKNYADF
ncbi:MAG: type II secretion system protein [Planctomycetes bacterium]|nr:type II secretion system protein [Planctomycetota bacterium]